MSILLDKKIQFQTDSSCNKKLKATANDDRAIHNQIFVQFFDRNQTSVEINRQPLKIANEKVEIVANAPATIDIGKLNWKDASFDKSLNPKELGEITVDEIKSILDEQVKSSNCPSGSFFEPRVGCIDIKHFLEIPRMKSFVDIDAIFSSPLKKLILRHENDDAANIQDKSDQKVEKPKLDSSEYLDLTASTSKEIKPEMQILSSQNNNDNLEILGMILQLLEKSSHENDFAGKGGELKNVLYMIEEKLKGRLSSDKQTIDMRSVVEGLKMKLGNQLVHVENSSGNLENSPTKLEISSTPAADGVKEIPLNMMQTADDVVQLISSLTKNHSNNLDSKISVNPSVEFSNEAFSSGLNSLKSTADLFGSQDFNFNFTSPEMIVKNTEPDPEVAGKLEVRASPSSEITFVQPKIQELIPINIVLKIPKDELYKTGEKRHVPLNIDLPSLLMQGSSKDSQHDMSMKILDVKKLENNLQKLLESAFHSQDSPSSDHDQTLEIISNPPENPQHEKIDSQNTISESNHYQAVDDTTVEPVKKKIPQAFLVREIPFRKNFIQENYHQKEQPSSTEKSFVPLIPSIMKSGEKIVKEHKSILSNFLPSFVSGRRSANPQSMTSKDSADEVLKQPRPEIVYKSIVGKTLEDYGTPEQADEVKTTLTDNYSDYSVLSDDIHTSSELPENDSTSPETESSKMSETSAVEEYSTVETSTDHLTELPFIDSFLSSLTEPTTTEDDLEHYDQIS